MLPSDDLRVNSGALLAETPQSRCRSDRATVVRTLALVAEVVGAWLAIRFLLGYPPGAFPWAGREFTGSGAPRELVVQPLTGYDGQFVYRLALNPFTTQVTESGLTFDNPAYRQQRILTAALANLVSHLPGVSAALALVMVNSAAVLIATVFGVLIAEGLGRPARYGVLLAIPACLPFSLSADLTEPVAWAAALICIWAAQRERWAIVGIALTAAALSRETAMLYVAAFAVQGLVRTCRGLRPIGHLWLALPVIVEGAWQFRLWQVWGEIPALVGFSNTVVSQSPRQGSSTLPGLDIVRTFFNGWLTGKICPPWLGISYVAERTVLLVLIGTAGLTLIRGWARPTLGLTISWGLAAAVALSMRGWNDDIQFLRPAMEVWGLSVLFLIQVRRRAADVALVAAATISIWSAVFALIRV